MNIIYLCGGLGNQLFQYAFGKAQEANGIEVRYNKNWYHVKVTPERPYVLDKFKTDVVVSDDMIRFIKREKGLDKGYVKVEGFTFKGYWQYYWYLSNVLEKIKDEFVVKEEYHTPEFIKLRDEIKGCNSVALHVRRGDYIGNPNWHILPLSYYVKALSVLKVCRPVDKVYVFSDDMRWCRENFNYLLSPNGVEFVHLDNYLDFDLMKSCKYFILANSTFGYFPALLGEAENKQVYCPKNWLGDKFQETGTRYPIDWIRI